MPPGTPASTVRNLRHYYRRNGLDPMAVSAV